MVKIKKEQYNFCWTVLNWTCVFLLYPTSNSFGSISQNITFKEILGYRKTTFKFSTKIWKKYKW